MSKKEEIANSYRKLVIERKSTKIPIHIICSDCHISRTTFYHYFKDSYEIIEYTLKQDAVNNSYYLLENAIIDDETAVVNWYLSFYKNKGFYIVCMKDEGQNSLFETIIETLYQHNIELFQHRYTNKTHTDIDYQSYKMASMQAMLLKKWMNEEMSVSPYKMAEYFLHNINE